MRHRQVLLILISLVVLSSHSLPVESRQIIRCHFKECVQIALRNNELIQAARQDENLSRAKLEQARPRGIPIVKYQHRIAPVPRDVDNARDSFFDGDISVFNNFKIEIGAPITTFGKIFTAKELANIGIDASWYKRQKESDQIVQKIYEIYHGVLLAREIIVLAGEGRKALNDKITDLEKESIKDQLQILKLKVALYEIERRYEEAKRRESLALSALKVQMGLEMDVDLDLKDKNLSATRFELKSLNHYLSKARAYRPEYKLLKAGVLAKEKQLKLEKLAPVPNLGYGGFFDIGRAPGVRGDEDESTFTNPFNFTKAGAGIELRGELDYVKMSSKVDQAKADLLKTIYKKRAAIKGLELEIQDTFFKAKEAESLMIKAENEKKVARQMVFLTRSNLDIGIGDKKDYYDALQSYLIFQGRGYEAIYNYNVAIATLKNKIGELYYNPERENR